MDSGSRTVNEVFAAALRLEVPLFQRPYVWTRDEQWEPLWEDVRSVTERIIAGRTTRQHFLGAVVLEQVSGVPTPVPTWLIIDGQQRLTTLQIMLEAIADLCESLGADQAGQALRPVTRNVVFGSHEPDLVFKVWPTNTDRDVYRAVMHAESASALIEAHQKERRAEPLPRLMEAYAYFHTAIHDWLHQIPDGQIQRLEALCLGVLNHLRFIVISLDQEDDAQLIFETLNARGTPLLPSDLVKNDLFHRAKAAKLDPAALYAKYWQPFDNEERYWRAKIGRGHAARARLDTFLHHYLITLTADDVPAGHLYTRFRRYVADDGDHTVESQLASLQRYATVYRGFDTPVTNDPLGGYVSRLNRMGLQTAYPVLLELFVTYGSAPDWQQSILNDLESFLVRRLVCQLSTRAYARMFVEVLQALRGLDGTPVERLRAYLQSSSADQLRWPTDDEFRRAWVDIAATRALQRDRVRMILERIALAMHDRKTEPIAFTNALTVEHILPGSWKTFWPLPHGADREAEWRRDDRLNAFGNLTLLTQPLNSEVSNGPWETKRAALREHTVLRMNQRLLDVKNWDEAAIERRSLELFDVATKVWPRPAAL